MKQATSVSRLIELSLPAQIAFPASVFIFAHLPMTGFFMKQATSVSRLIELSLPAQLAFLALVFIFAHFPITDFSLNLSNQFLFLNSVKNFNEK